ncbi:MAG: beta-propeller fold lactonase family protein [Terriglobales bacterium]|jgi:6-phosphogluconolactonase (cycloisomerase 2 family)
MSVLRTARAVLDLKWVGGMGAILVLVFLAVSLFSCGSGKLPQFGSTHNAYVTLPTLGSVALLQINSLTGSITVGAQTPQATGTSPSGLALLSNKYLYVANSQANTISTFNVAADGTLTPGAAAIPTGGTSPHAAIIDPSGKYLLVTNSSLSDSVSVFSIDTSSGVLTQVTGSPFFAYDTPTEIVMPASGNLVYASNPRIGTVTAFVFDTTSTVCGVLLCPVAGSPFTSGKGASALVVDRSGQHLYVANTSAVNTQSTAIGNISGFNINTTTGVLSPIPGSPFTSNVGSGPSTLVIDTEGNFLYATTPGSNYSVWCFEINSQTGSTDGQLTAVNGSPFSVVAGGLFALIDTKGSFLFIGDQNANGISAYTYDQNSGQPTVILNSPFSTGTAPGQMVFAD